MNNPLKRIGLVLISLILIPALLFTAIEINSINESEKVLENIYLTQLESVLLSINRFSDDVLSDWTNDLESRITLDKQLSLNAIYNDLKKNRNSLDNLFRIDSSLTDLILLGSDVPQSVNIDIKFILTENKNKIGKLFTYLDGGYRKLEPLNTANTEENIVVFVLNYKNKKTVFGYLINAERFIKQVLSPKIQEVAREDIVIKCFRKTGNSLVYSTDSYYDSKEIIAKKEFWLFPNYEIGISLKGESLEEIVKARSYFNLSLLGALNFLLLIALFYLYKSIKKEIHFAQLKSEFVSNVSHELRTPLALISMFAETLELDRVKTEEKKKEYYSIISQEAQRLSKIVNSILNFSKMESGKRKYNLVSININDVVEKVLSAYEFHLQNKGFKVELNLDESVKTILGDEEAISECLINLIDNGVKYSTDEKKLIIFTTQKEEKVCLQVKDFGIGINKEDQKKVFEKFYRVPSNLVHNTKGTGLGLSLVFQIMQAHNGKVILESVIGKGSTFSLCFPSEK